MKATDIAGGEASINTFHLCTVDHGRQCQRFSRQSVKFSAAAKLTHPR
jgi:hypothetical protein